MNSRRIIVSSPELGLSGATAFMAKLITRLQKEGWEPEWLVTGHMPKPDSQWLGDVPWPIHRFPKTKIGGVRQRQDMLIECLQKASPCIYLPTFDFDMLHAVPALPPAVAVGLVVHSDEPVYYENAARFERGLNAVIGVSEHITGKLKKTLKHSAGRIHKITYGVEQISDAWTLDRKTNQPLEVIYCGRLSFYQKRIQDLAAIIQQCHVRKLPIHFSIAGAGADEAVFFQSIAAAVNDGFVRRLGLLSNRETLQALSHTDVVIMTSDFEGLPVILLEAMSQGCIPVVSRIDSGVTELIQDGENGLLAAIGDIEAFVSALARLASEPSWRQQLSLAAIDRIHAGGFTLERAAAEYGKLFETLLQAADRYQAIRKGKASLPQNYRFTHRIKRRLVNMVKPAK